MNDSEQYILSWRFTYCIYSTISAINRESPLMVVQFLRGCFNNRSLSLFCVSNKAYKKNRRRVRTHDLLMKGSGILTLQIYVAMQQVNDLAQRIDIRQERCLVEELWRTLCILGCPILRRRKASLY